MKKKEKFAVKDEKCVYDRDFGGYKWVARFGDQWMTTRNQINEDCEETTLVRKLARESHSFNVCGYSNDGFVVNDDENGESCSEHDDDEDDEMGFSSDDDEDDDEDEGDSSSDNDSYCNENRDGNWATNWATNEDSADEDWTMNLNK